MPDKKFSDVQIVETINSGNEEHVNKVLKYLYEGSCYSLINKFICSNNGSPERAKDVFQDAMTVFYVQVQKNLFNQKSSVNTYIYGIAKNIWYSELKKQNKLDAAIAETKARNIEMSHEFISINEESESLKLFNKLFDKLSVDCQKMLRCFYYEKLTIEETLSKFEDLSKNRSVITKKYRCMKCLMEIYRQNKITKDDFNTAEL